MMGRSLPVLACVASASAFLSGPMAVPGTTRYQSAVNMRSGLTLRSGRAATPLKMQTKTGVDTAALAKAANEARGLAMDSIAAAHSGHLGLPLGCAEVRCEPGEGGSFDSRDPSGHRCRAWRCADIACIVQIGAVLYSDFLQHNPKDPQWLNRDRFVLSGGHGTLSKTVACAAVP